ncbi:MAG: amidase, partial [Pseudomonadales bacterium]|nr:amidase [Pseudomonadales bacterium]
MTDSRLYDLTATELTRLVQQRELTATTVTEAFLDRIATHNPAINAIVTLVPEMAMAQAKALDARIAQGEQPGPLAGLPIAHKDLTETAGIRTTFGSPRFRDYVPDQSSLLVTRIQAAGGITTGKTNTPEF